MPEAFAKINRELRVGGRRSDGFHEIRSRFSTIDLSDSIEIEEIPVLAKLDSGSIREEFERSIPFGDIDSDLLPVFVPQTVIDEVIARPEVEAATD